MNSVAHALILGGYGSVGSRIARLLRHLQPGLPIAIAGRDLAKAESIAVEIGNATAVSIDIEKPELGIAPSEPSHLVARLRLFGLDLVAIGQTT